MNLTINKHIMIKQLLQERLKVYNNTALINELVDYVNKIGATIVKTKGSKKIFVCGNGGSSSQASHLAAELTVRYKGKRNDYFALALTSDTSVITAISNDYNFDDIFAMQIENMADSGDVLLALSTSGNSKNVNNALEKAVELNMQTFALLGKTGGQALRIANEALVVPSDDVAIVQEVHLMVIHLLCEYLEKFEQ